jgi:hypothetical protein
MYPIFTPIEYTPPRDAGPTALATADTLVATPFRVPRTRRLGAELVKRIVTEGKEKMTAANLRNMRVKAANRRARSVGKRTVNGVKR